MNILCSRSCPLALLAGVAALAVSSLSGCVGYNVYPPMEGEHGFTNVNSDPFPPLMTESLKWTVLRYPPNEHGEYNEPAAGNVGVNQFAINLPPGVNRQLGERIAKNVGMGAQPMLPGNDNLPTYSIARVWVKGDEAKVDIVRPVFNVAFDGHGAPVTQGITIRLRGGLEQWRVTSHRLWSYNSMAVPAISFLPGSDMAPAARATAASDAADATSVQPATTQATPENN